MHLGPRCSEASQVIRHLAQGLPVETRDPCTILQSMDTVGAQECPGERGAVPTSGTHTATARAVAGPSYLVWKPTRPLRLSMWRDLSF